MEVVIRKRLDEHFATESELAEMSDEEVIELVREDVCGFLEGAAWEVSRGPVDAGDLQAQVASLSRQNTKLKLDMEELWDKYAEAKRRLGEEP